MLQYFLCIHSPLLIPVQNPQDHILRLMAQMPREQNLALDDLIVQIIV